MHKELEGQTHLCGPDEIILGIILGDEVQEVQEADGG